MKIIGDGLMKCGRAMGLTVAMLALAGCGSALQHGHHQEIELSTSPPNTVCEFSNHLGVVFSSVVVGEGGITVYNVRRGAWPIRVVCSKRGYVDTQMIIKPIDITQPQPDGSKPQIGEVIAGLGTDLVLNTMNVYPSDIHLNLLPI